VGRLTSIAHVELDVIRSQQWKKIRFDSRNFQNGMGGRCK
jgi:hypothetical protein